MRRTHFLVLLLLIACTVHLESCAVNKWHPRLPGRDDSAFKLRLRYFYHSGWMIETAKHVLVFDFIPYPAARIDYTTLEQDLQKPSNAGKEIYFFISHDHDDHFNKELFAIGDKLKNVRFVLGWKFRHSVQNAYTLSPGDSLYLTGIKVNTHSATDDGSAFLVRVDGFTFYHSGDHALWAEALRPQFINELTSLQRHFQSVDLAFLVAAKGIAAGCHTTDAIVEGIRMSAAILKPSAIALQHIGCPDKLAQYKTIQKQVGNHSKRWITPSAYNQSFDLSK